MKLENNIGWCDLTENPGIGCRGCELGDECYAKFNTPARVLRAGKWPGRMGQPTETFGPGRTFVPTKNGLEKLRAWNKFCICDQCHETQMFSNLAFRRTCRNNGCQGELRRIRAFCDSNSDWMDWPIDVLAAALEEIRTAPNVDVILLTKWPWLFRERMNAAIVHMESNRTPKNSDTGSFITSWLQGHPPKHVITLTSVLGNANDGERLAGILEMPAAIRGLSCEPLWSSVDFQMSYAPFGAFIIPNGIHWIIVGCDSSKKHKGWETYAMNAERIIEQRRASGVRVYHKQMPINGRVSMNPADWPDALRVREFYAPEPMNIQSRTK